MIDVVDPKSTSLKKGHVRFEEANAKNPGFKRQCTWHSDLRHVAKANSDLVIVSTDASIRSQVILSLAKTGKHQLFLLEKPVCQSEDEYNRILEIFHAKSCRGWVNTIRRYNPFYQRYACSGNVGGINMQVTGKLFGLGSNAIHFLDLFQMIAGGEGVKITKTKLLRSTSSSKRGSNFLEIEGSIYGTDNIGNRFMLSSLESETKTIKVKISKKDLSINVDEVNCTIVLKDNDGYRRETFQELLVSKSTTSISTDLLETGNCLLPPLASSYGIHRQLFLHFRNYLYEVTGLCYEKIPIT